MNNVVVTVFIAGITPTNYSVLAKHPSDGRVSA